MSKAQQSTTPSATAGVIDFAAARAARTKPVATPPQVQRIAIGDDTLIVSTGPNGELQAQSERYLRRMLHPTVNALPFVGRDEDGMVTSYWAPDANARHSDGREWGVALFAALVADGCDGWPVEAVFNGVIEDGIRRRVKGGKGSRATLTAVTDGLLRGFAEAAVAAAAGKFVPEGGAA